LENTERIMVRLFIALHIPENIKNELGRLIGDLKSYADGIKWVAPHNMHLTLKFIGETEKNNIDPICHKLDSILSGQPKFEVAVEGLGGFPHLRNPRVLWVGLNNCRPAIEMASRIDENLAELGFEAEKKKFSPHLTLGRIKNRGDFSRLAAHMENLKYHAGNVILDRVALVQSTLTPQGPIYKNVKEYLLA